MIKAFVGHCLAMFRVNIFKIKAGKLRIMIMLQFERMYKFAIILRERPKTAMFMISGPLGRVGTLICGFEYAKLLKTSELLFWKFEL